MFVDLLARVRALDAAAWTAVFTAIAAIAAALYVELTRRLWRETAMQREAELMLTLMADYDNLRDSVTFVRGWFNESASSGPTDPLQRFRDETFDESGGTERGWEVDRHRFLLSRFFVRTRKLVDGGYLSEDIVVRALGGQAIQEVFLGMVDKLDEAKSGHNYGHADRVFYQRLLQKHPRKRALRRNKE